MEYMSCPEAAAKWGISERRVQIQMCIRDRDIDGNFVDEHALTSAMSRVRNKIETGTIQYIKTVYGMGYMWIGGMNK